jgi:hypothetical protein
MNQPPRLQISVRLVPAEHRLIAAEAALLGLSLNQFVLSAALGRALYERGRRGAPNPYQRGGAYQAGRKDRER